MIDRIEQGCDSDRATTLLIFAFVIDSDHLDDRVGIRFVFLNLHGEQGDRFEILAWQAQIPSVAIDLQSIDETNDRIFILKLRFLHLEIDVNQLVLEVLFLDIYSLEANLAASLRLERQVHSLHHCLIDQLFSQEFLDRIDRLEADLRVFFDLQLI